MIDYDDNSVGAQDFDEITEIDNHWIGKRTIIQGVSSQPYFLDGKGGETPIFTRRYVYSDWAREEAESAEKNAIDIRLEYPSLDITRLNFAKLAMKLYHKMQPDAQLPSGKPCFSDTADSNILSASVLGIVTGYEDGTFRPYATITREEAAAMLNRLYRVLGGAETAEGSEPYADDAQFGAWSRDSIYAMREIGIMKGEENNAFHPAGGYTGEQAVVTMERMYQLFS